MVRAARVIDAAKIGKRDVRILRVDRGFASLVEFAYAAVADVQVIGLKRAVVQVVDPPTAVSGAEKDLRGVDIAAEFAFVTSFHKVVLLFDDDGPGQEAALAVAQMLPVGKAFIGRISGYKDANAALVAGKEKAVMDAIFQAKPWVPQGIMGVGELIERAISVPEMGIPWWDERLSKLTYGRRWGEIVGVGAGSGVGKSDWIAQFVV